MAARSEAACAVSWRVCAAVRAMRSRLARGGWVGCGCGVGSAGGGAGVGCQVEKVMADIAAVVGKVGLLGRAVGLREERAVVDVREFTKGAFWKRSAIFYSFGSVLKLFVALLLYCTVQYTEYSAVRVYRHVQTRVPSCTELINGTSLSGLAKICTHVPAVDVGRCYWTIQANQPQPCNLLPQLHDWAATRGTSTECLSGLSHTKLNLVANCVGQRG